MRSQPFKCPVCDGLGKHPTIIDGRRGYGPDDCRACEGKGIVWSYDMTPAPYVPYIPYVPYEPQPIRPWSPTWIVTSNRTTAKPLSAGSDWMSS